MTATAATIDALIEGLVEAVEDIGFEGVADAIEAAGDSLANSDLTPPPFAEALIGAVKTAIRSTGTVTEGGRTLTLHTAPGTFLHFAWQPGTNPPPLWADAVASSVSHATGLSLIAAQAETAP